MEKLDDFKEAYLKIQPVLQDACRKKFIPHITGFVTIRPDKTPVQFGSGVLLQIAGSHFVLTAAHIFDETTKYKLPIGIITGLNDDPALFIDNKEVLAFSVRRDRFDVCAIRLSREMADIMLSKGRRFCTLSDADPLDMTSQQGKKVWYAVFGFPASNQRMIDEGTILYSRAQFYCSTTFDNQKNELDRISGFDPKVHIAIHFERSDAADCDGKASKLPHPSGMSGCGVWRMTDDIPSITSCDVSKAKLVGIETGFVEKFNCMKATKLIMAVKLIYEGFPDLRSAIKLNFQPPAKFIQPVEFRLLLPRA